MQDMISLRPAAERGHADFGWLDSRHTFSFGAYYDGRHMGHGPLRVINEDRVAPGGGFAPHAHHDMEILSWVLSGALKHQDSLGTSSVIRPGELQRMSAGTGVRHSEYNDSRTEPVHFLQIWILPAQQGLRPSYEQRRYDDLGGRLRLLASGNGRDGSVRLHQDADLYVARLARGQQVRHGFGPGRLGWVQIARGGATLDGQALDAGDGAALAALGELTLTAADTSEVLLFDLGP